MPKDDLSQLEKMTYSGRGIIAGKTPSGNNFMAYILTGRSPSSQARKLVYDEDAGVISTEVTDPEILSKGNQALLIYPAIMHNNESLIASNGKQTEFIYNTKNNFPERTPQFLLKKLFENPIYQYDPINGFIDLSSFEPDHPNNTPRIGAYLRSDQLGMHISKKVKGNLTKLSFPNTIHNGKAKLVTTYKGENEKPLLPFEGEPLDIQISSETAEEIAENIYRTIEPKGGNNFGVAAAAMVITDGRPSVSTINRLK